MKLSRRRQILSFGIGLLLWAILPLNSFAAQVCYDDSVATAFDNTIAGKMVVALEQAKLTEGQIEALNGSSQELIQQKEILQSTIKLLQDQIVVYKNMSEMNQKMSDMKDKACEEQVKAAKPTFGQNMTKYLAGFGAGGAFVVVLLLLL